ncbi:MAG TPA: MFS transporter [Ktedonobacterales bacterium]|nr:MFS transporter [Ktedonobacterales bacterium]
MLEASSDAVIPLANTPAASERTVPPSPASQGARATRLALGVVCVAVFLTALDQTVVFTALPAMIQDIAVPITALDRAAWIVSGYLLGYVIAMPLMGRVADVYGRRRVFAICLAIFGVGSALCALAPALGSPVAPDTSTFAGLLLTPVYTVAQWLLGLAAQVGIDATYPALNVLVSARFLQALGGGALVPVALAVVGDLFGGTRRGLALGLIGAVTEAGGVLGPLWGAWITTTLGWTWIFWLNLPLVVVLLLAGSLALPRATRQREGIDLAGALLLGGAVACLTIGLGAQAGAPGTLSLTNQVAANPWLLLAAAGLLLVFGVLESRLRWPVVDPALFRRLAFTAASGLSLLIGAALIIAMAVIPLYFYTVLNRPEIESGLALLRLTALIPVGALLGGWLSSRIGLRVTAALGCLLTATGFVLMHFWTVSVADAQITAATVVAGFGFGLVIAPISTSALNAVAARQSGSASALITVLRMIGMIVGLGVLVAWALTRFNTMLRQFPKLAQNPGESPADYLAREQNFYYHLGVLAAHLVLTDTFLVAAALCALAVIPALLLWRRPATGDQNGQHAYASYVAPMA